MTYKFGTELFIGTYQICLSVAGCGNYLGNSRNGIDLFIRLDTKSETSCLPV